MLSAITTNVFSKARFPVQCFADERDFGIIRVAAVWPYEHSPNVKDLVEAPNGKDLKYSFVAIHDRQEFFVPLGCLLQF